MQTNFTEEIPFKELKWYQKAFHILLEKVGCVAPTGLSYKIYDFLAGKLNCTCCIFWRGLFLGAAIAFFITFAATR